LQQLGAQFLRQQRVASLRIQQQQERQFVSVRLLYGQVVESCDFNHNVIFQLGLTVRQSPMTLNTEAEKPKKPET